MTEASPELTVAPRIVGRYALFDEIAAGGMATVHLGRLVGQVGFSRTVAVKRLHPQYAKDREFVTMFVDEARLASRIQHPNVVSTLDVVKTQNELFLVMEYVQGEALSRLVRNAAKRGGRIPPKIVLSVMSGMLHGLHAAHEAKSETREPLNIVHRDISPQNVLVGLDGVARVLDFGVAKAAMRSGATRDGQMKGKLSYMSPEQLNGKDIDRRSDIFAAGIVLWEALAGKRLFSGADAGEILGKVLTAEIPSPKSVVPSLPDEVSDAVMKSLERDPDTRFQTARDFAVALEKAAHLATAHTVGEWVREYGGEELGKRLNLVARVEGYPMDELGDAHSGIELMPPGLGPDPAGTGTGATRVEGVSTEASGAEFSAVGDRRRNRVVLLGLGAIFALGLGLWAAMVVQRDDPRVVPQLEGSAVTQGHTAAAGRVAPIEPNGAGSDGPGVGSAEEFVDPAGTVVVDDAEPTADEATADETAEADVTTEPSGSAAGTARVVPTSVSRPRPQPQPVRTPRPKAQPTPNKCDPPYTIGDDGVRKLKPECLR